MKVLIIIPAYNEEKSIERVVDNIIDNYPQYDYVVVNDGSKDNTAKICRERGYEFLDLPINLGLSGAFQTGMRYADKKEFDCAIQLDGDGQHNPFYIAQMLECLSKGDADIVIGSRFFDKGKRSFSLRTIGSYILRICIKLTTGATIYDPTSGMRLYGKRAIREFAYNMNYTPEPDTISYLIRCGIRVKEVQVEMSERLEGESYLNMQAAMKYMLHMCTSILLIQTFRKRGK